MDAATLRFACLIAASAILHAATLAPLKASSSPSRLRFSPQLTVDLPARDSPLTAPPVALATAPEAAPSAPVTTAETTVAPVGALPAAPNTEPTESSKVYRSVPTPQPKGHPLSGDNNSSPNPGTQTKGGVRLALPDEVSVRVHLLNYEGGQKPRDSIEIQGKTYRYFKSPSLKQAAQPLEDAKPHYPAQKPEYLNGAVILQLLIDEEGNLEQVVTVCANPKFEKSAVASIEKMRFLPAQGASGPVKSYMVVEFGYGRGYPCAPVPD